MVLSKLKPKKGKLLISEPFLHGPYFQRSVVLLTEHNKNGSSGLILNKPIDLKLKEAIEDFPAYSGQVYLGGPVNKNNLFFLHTLGEEIEESEEILPGLFWGGNFERVKALIAQKKVKDNELRFFAGYSGWEPKQLHQEIEEQSWIVGNTKAEFIMNVDKVSSMWSDALKNMGSEYAILANFPVDPNLN